MQMQCVFLVLGTWIQKLIIGTALLLHVKNNTIHLLYITFELMWLAKKTKVSIQ